jgi:hypothetical protein
MVLAATTQILSWVEATVHLGRETPDSGGITALPSRGDTISLNSAFTARVVDQRCRGVVDEQIRRRLGKRAR